MAVWPPFGTVLLTRLTVCSLDIMSVCNFGCFSFWLRGQDFGSDWTSSWSLLTFFLFDKETRRIILSK